MQIYFKFKSTVLKRLLYLVIIPVCFFYSSYLTAQESKGEKITTVVIDAGHGGKDPGAIGKHVREKDVTLKVALKVGKYIEENLPDVKVIYTRSKDVFIPLKKRGQIANKNNADLFVSIHCNAVGNSKVYGPETYVLGSDESRINRNMKVAMLENAAILLEEDSEDSYNGFDPNLPESYIIFSLKQNDYKQQKSIELAQKIQNQFRKRAGRKDRGVHQAGFLVLAGTYMPSVLVELGYLTNTAEEKYLMSDKGQSILASAIYRAIKEYKKEYDLDNKVEKKDKNISKPKKNNTHYTVQFYVSSKKANLNSRKFRKIPEVSYCYSNGLYKYTSGDFKNISDAATRQKLLKKLGFKDAWIAKNNDNAKSASKQNIKNQLHYRVQFYTSSKKISLSNKKFSGIKDVSYYYSGGLYKYTAGYFKNNRDAVKAMKELRKKGYKDAFIIKMKGDKRVK